MQKARNIHNNNSVRGFVIKGKTIGFSMKQVYNWWQWTSDEMKNYLLQDVSKCDQACA